MAQEGLGVSYCRSPAPGIPAGETALASDDTDTSRDAKLACLLTETLSNIYGIGYMKLS